MKVLHLNAGNETGGGMVHILSLLNEFDREQFYLGLFERGELYNRANDKGINTVLFEQTSRLDLSAVFKVVIFIKQEGIDIIHTHGARANLYGYFIRMFTGKVWMTTIHSDPRNDFLGRGIKGKMFTRLNMAVLKKANHYFAISSRFKEMLNEFDIDDNKITTIYNGIDFSKIPLKKNDIIKNQLNISPEEFVILMVARFDPVKLHKDAIDAVKEALKIKPNIRMLLIGDGSEKGEMEAYVANLGLEKQINFLGFRDNVDLFYNIADITLLTSKTESFPLVLLESSRAETPVITTDVGGVKEMIPDSSYSFIVPVGDISAIEESILEMIDLKKKGKIEEMGERFFNFTSSHFSLEAFCSSIYMVYERHTF